MGSEAFARWAARTEATLDRLLPDPSLEPRRLHAAMRHATLGGGKRMRPMLTLAAANNVHDLPGLGLQQALGTDADDVDDDLDACCSMASSVRIRFRDARDVRRGADAELFGSGSGTGS